MRFSGLILLIIILGIPGYMYLEPFLIETKEITIESSDIPSNFNGKTIVFISDIHACSYFKIDRLDSLINKVNSMNPDLILLGGDYTDKNDTIIQPTFDSLSNLKARYGVYGVLGNTDPQYHTLNAFGNSKINYIGNQGIWISEGSQKIRIGGVGDNNNGNQIESTAIGDAKSSDFMVLVTHNPDYFPKANKAVIDLVLSGHTHGGQITFFGLYAPITNSIYGQKYRTGVIEENGSTLIVSNGIGTADIPLRFFAPPQIIKITLKKN
ncbi:MAG: metallophosphoesterase [Methanobacteriaceae archaeon]